MPEVHVRWNHPLKMQSLDIPGATLKKEYKEILAVVVGEDLDVLFLPDQQLLCFLQLIGIRRIEGVAQIFERHADIVGGIAQKRYAAGDETRLD